MGMTDAVAILRRSPPRASDLFWLALAFIMVVVFSTFTSAENLPVMLPIITATCGIVFFFWMLHQRQGRIFPFFETGAVYVAIVSLYTLYPLFGFISNGLSYTPFNDSRLYVAQPTPQEIGTIGWYYVVHLMSFIVAYLLVRGRLPRKQTRFKTPDQTTLLVVVLLYLVIKGFFLFLGLFFDLSAGSYSESYLVSGRLPLVLAQLWNHLNGAIVVLALVIMAALFGNYRKYRLLIFGWLILLTLITFYRLGSRTELVLLLLSSAMMFHHLVKPIRFRLVVLVGVAGLCSFVILGLQRRGLPLSELDLEFKPFAYASEFEIIFANAYDLCRLKAKGVIGDLPVTFYLSDLLALVPQQFIPFAKISPAVWYVHTFYPEYAAAGGGLAFGTISESILGGGWLDLLGRGAFLGFILAQVHRYYATHHTTLWRFIFYVWVTVLSYQLFRGTTFYLLGLSFYRFLPILVGVKLLSALLKGSIWTKPQSSLS